jgi:hypothetical protein
MRRVLARCIAAPITGAIAVATMIAFAALSACSRGPDAVSPMAVPTPSVLSTASPTPSAGDPNLTLQVCTAATLAAADGAKLFNEQWARLEKAAAKDDPAAMVRAAELIQRTFVELAAGLGTLSRKSVSPQVKLALAEGSAVLTEIASQKYSGTTADINRELADLAAGFAKACP